MRNKLVERNKANLERAINVYKRKIKSPEEDIDPTDEVKEVMVESLTDVSLLLQIPVPPIIIEYDPGTASATKQGHILAGTSAIGFEAAMLKRTSEQLDSGHKTFMIDSLRESVAHELYHFAVELADPEKDLASRQANYEKGEAYKNDPGEKEARKFGETYALMKRVGDVAAYWKRMAQFYKKTERKNN